MADRDLRKGPLASYVLFCMLRHIAHKHGKGHNAFVFHPKLQQYCHYKYPLKPWDVVKSSSAVELTSASSHSLHRDSNSTQENGEVCFCFWIICPVTDSVLVMVGHRKTCVWLLLIMNQILMCVWLHVTGESCERLRGSQGVINRVTLSGGCGTLKKRGERRWHDVNSLPIADIKDV